MNFLLKNRPRTAAARLFDPAYIMFVRTGMRVAAATCSFVCPENGLD
jgi:hypothetical protein